MSLPAFCTQSELFSTAALSGTLFAKDDRYRLFAKLIYPAVVATRPDLEKCYCLQDGRPAVEPVLLLGVSILQELDGMPDRQAIEMLRYLFEEQFELLPGGAGPSARDKEPVSAAVGPDLAEPQSLAPPTQATATRATCRCPARRRLWRPAARAHHTANVPGPGASPR